MTEPSKITFRVFRKEPDSDSHRIDTYEVDMVEGMSVLDALTLIKDWQDTSLSYRSSCRSAICGSCAMTINGHAKLACRTQVKDEVAKWGEVRVEPLGNFPVLKDLVFDLNPYWKQVNSVTPWLEDRPDGKEGESAPLTEKGMEQFKGVEDCILCGACYGQCTAYEADNRFIGPAALAKGYRFTVDPRDGKGLERLMEGLQDEKGIWSCARCYFCSQVCPKDVQPAKAIGRLQEMASKEGTVNTEGTRYAKAIKNDIEKIGRINETTLPLRVAKINPDTIISMVPMGITLLLKRKLPSPLMRSLKGIADVKSIFRRIRERGEEK
ncbi:MAG: succinate dehydrogenase/fumarate reductase iron-sulfur subunit [Nitrospirota bacterium]|nr:succinate dehydrogenase/fumarate reductase iron-sulfur subunit [Nitrospirota bacterium]